MGIIYNIIYKNNEPLIYFGSDIDKDIINR